MLLFARFFTLISSLVDLVIIVCIPVCLLPLDSRLICVAS
jgi:hypothetical protein